MLYIFLGLLICINIFGGVFANESEVKNTINVELEANWKEIPFKLSYLESIASYNGSLFLPALEKIIGYNVDSGSDDEELENQMVKSDSELYHNVMDQLQLDQSAKDFINFNLVYKRYNPRVETHFKHYEEIKRTYSERLISECSKDSFGKKIEFVNGMPQAWIVYNDKLYCSSDDLYALKTDTKVSDNMLPFDREIGENKDAPLLVLYGNIESDEFKDMLLRLIESQEHGKIRFTWRYTPSNIPTKYEKLGGYGVDLTIKNPQNLITTEKVTSIGKLDIENNNINNIIENSSFVPLEKDKINQLGVKLMSFVLKNSENSFELLDKILQNFPTLASYIANYNPDDLEEIESIIKENERLGITEDSYGLYINGSPINKLELDVFSLVDKLKSELLIIKELEDLGFTTHQAKVIITKFALISAVKNAQFENGNNMMGSNVNRYRVFEDKFVKGTNSGAVVFMNDIENDDSYYEYSDNREELYLNYFIMSHPNKLPPLRENIHDLIFALNFSDKRQLKVFFTFAKLILDNGVPQQIGIMPIPSDNEKDLEIAKIFYFLSDISDVKESLAFLYKYFEATDEEAYTELLSKIQIPEDYIFDKKIYTTTAEKYSILEPSIVINGVIYEMATSNWQMNVKNQLAQDTRLIQLYVTQGRGKNQKLKSLLYEGAKSERNLRIIPSDLDLILYKGISTDLIQNSVAFTKGSNAELPASFWLIGDFNEKKIVQQFINILEVISSSPKSLQLRIINFGLENDLMNRIEAHAIDRQNDFDISLIKLWVEEFNFQESSNKKNESIIELLIQNNLPVFHSYVLFNSRYLRIVEILSHSDLQLLVDYEVSQRLSIIPDIIESQKIDFESKSIYEICNEESFSDWFDKVSSVVTNSFYLFESFFISDVFRYDFSPILGQKSLSLDSHNKNLPLDILLILDPVSEDAQKMISILNSIKQFSFVNIDIILLPKLHYNEKLEIQRYFKGIYPSSTPFFEDDGSYCKGFSAHFENLPSNIHMALELDIPEKWLTMVKRTLTQADIDNIYFSNELYNNAIATYGLKYILIEGYARDVKFATVPKNLTLELLNKNFKYDTRVLNNLGYFQLKSYPGLWNFKEGSSSHSNYSLLSATERKLSANRTPLEQVRLAVTDLSGHVLTPRFTSEHLKDAPNDGKLSQMKSFFKSRKNIKDIPPKEADINIFTVVSGQSYEKLAAIMVASVREHTSSSIKFWFIENYLSPNFKTLVAEMAQIYDFDYEFISYKWPNWLRYQRQKHRKVWGYKILFLDLLFPQDLKRVIFVDADQISRTDMKELMEMDLDGAPYAFTPMCESNKEMEGYMFWKKDYWAKVLQKDLKYHISAMFVVDLERFKEIDAGDILRSHYQKLSSDPNSLANLDQDLPNNLQRRIKIHSLPQEWLWCETWCSQDTLGSAKLIDLCNNPLSKESKVDVAQRLIPEWSTYEKDVQMLLDKQNERIMVEDDEKIQSSILTTEAGRVTDNYGYNVDEEDVEYTHDEL